MPQGALEEQQRGSSKVGVVGLDSGSQDVFLFYREGQVPCGAQGNRAERDDTLEVGSGTGLEMGFRRKLWTSMSSFF